MNPEHARRLREVLDLVFQVELENASVALRGFLQDGRGWQKLNPELPAGSHSWRQLLEAVASGALRFGLVDDEFFDRLVAQAVGAKDAIEQVRLELVHPERLPPKWTAIGPMGGAIERIEVDPHDGNRLLCCAHLPFYDEPSRIGLFRSVDRGASWSRLEVEGVPPLLVRWIAFDPRRPGHVFLCTENGLWSSEDHGDSWLQDVASKEGIPVWQMRFHPIHEGARFVASGKDEGSGGGTSASSTTSIGGAGAVSAVSDLGAEYEVQRVVGREPGWFHYFDAEVEEWASIDLRHSQYAAAFAARDWRKLWIATTKNILKTEDCCRTFRVMGSVGETHVWDIAAHPDNNNSVLVAADNGIYRSADGGLHLERTCDARNARQLIFADEVWFAATARGPLHSLDDGRSWQVIGQGFPAQRCWSLTRATDGTLFAGGEGAGVYRLDVGSDVWIPRSDGLLDIPVGRPSFATPVAWAVPSAFGLYLTLDGGNAWNHSGPAGKAATADRRLIHLAAAGESYSGVQLTRDAGHSWHTTSDLEGTVFWLRLGSGTVWARTNGGHLVRMKADLSWQNDGPGSAAALIWLTDVLVIEEHWVAIATEGTLYQRQGSSAAWEVIERNPAELKCTAGTWRLATTGIGWFAWKYEGGLYTCAEFGKRWEEVTLPAAVTAIGGICGEPGAAEIAWAAAVDGTLFGLAAADNGWQWHRVTDKWSNGSCAYLDALEMPPSVVGSGSGGLFSFPVRNGPAPTT
jgi:hypothetical protein